MKSPAKQLQTAWRHHLRSKARLLSLWAPVGVALLVKAYGPRSTGLGTDLLWSFLLYGTLGVIATRLGFSFREVWRRCATRWAVETGVDLRRDPSVPEALPGLMRQFSLAGVLALGLAVGAHQWIPGDLRGAVLLVSPIAYFLYVGALCGLVACLSGAALCLLHLGIAALVHGGQAVRSRRGIWIGWAALAGHLAWLGFAVNGLPAWTPLALIAAALLASLALIQLGPAWELSMLWRSPTGGRPFARLSSARIARHGVWWIGATVYSLVLPLLGRPIWVTEAAPGLATKLGLFGAWVGVAVSIWATGCFARVAYLRRRRNPARKVPVRLVLVDEPRKPGAALAAPLRAAGFTVVGGGLARAAGDVPIRLRGRVPGTPTPWALVVDWEQLDAPELHARLRRRATLRRRRRLLHGLNDLWSEVSRWSKPEDRGYWLAPQYWFLARVFRDGEGGTEDEPAPARDPGDLRYQRYMAIEARSEMQGVLRSAQVDLIYVERGVAVRSLRRVFQALFEYHDLFGGQRPAAERHFVGIQGVRILIHDQECGELPSASGYVEPDYRMFGSARILHVFRDDGGTEVVDPAPSGWESTPFSFKDLPLLTHD